MTIVLGEGAEFEAQHVTFKGMQRFEVPAHHKLVIKQDAQGQLLYEQTPIYQPSWQWSYTFDDQDRIILKKIYS
jgi:hypothetical protein